MTNFYGNKKNDKSPDILILGAGAAGLMAGISAAKSGACVLILEKNQNPGIKILMSGGSRCNITHDCDNLGIIKAFGEKGKFLHSALAAFTTQDTITFFTNAGVKTKVESTGKVFPESNRAQHVLDALLAMLSQTGATIACNEPALAIHQGANGLEVVTPSRSIRPRLVILTTGGKSFPRCGTTGEGYSFAKTLGHEITPLRPALVPISIGDKWAHMLSGITAPDLQLNLYSLPIDQVAKKLGHSRGSTLFTHVGLSGPCPLNLTRIEGPWHTPSKMRLEVDFFPGLSDAEFINCLRVAASTDGKRLASSVLGDYLPRRLVDTLLNPDLFSGLSKMAELSREARTSLLSVMKKLTIMYTGNLGFDKAEVTAGGIYLGEVDSRSMRSYKTPHLFFAGEILDLDGPIGGYNFQAAWSTGWLAGKKAASCLGEMPINTEC